MEGELGYYETKNVVLGKLQAQASWEMVGCLSPYRGIFGWTLVLIKWF